MEMADCPHKSKKGSFWWRDNLKLLDVFKGMTVVNIQDGSTCLFWFDLWGGQAQNHTYPELFSFAKNKLLSVQKALEVEPFHRMFHLPLSEEAFQQMELLHQLLQEQYFSDSTDLWHYIWGSPLFSSKKAYLHLTGHAQEHAVFSWLWKSSCQKKHKVFFWLLLKDRLSTRNILRRKTMVLDSYACELCNTGQEEMLEHLFFSMPIRCIMLESITSSSPTSSNSFGNYGQSSSSASHAHFYEHLNPSLLDNLVHKKWSYL